MGGAGELLGESVHGLESRAMLCPECAGVTGELLGSCISQEGFQATEAQAGAIGKANSTEIGCLTRIWSLAASELKVIPLFGRAS